MQLTGNASGLKCNYVVKLRDRLNAVLLFGPAYARFATLAGRRLPEYPARVCVE
tara:strand:+ start:662 stop:823 length:162 start_codon:yes stop_codon:yes gene_type:complete